MDACALAGHPAPEMEWTPDGVMKWSACPYCAGRKSSERPERSFPGLGVLGNLLRRG